MKISKTKGLFRPFEDLKTLLETKSIPLKREPAALPPGAPEPEANPDKDRAMFEAAMADVERIPQNICAYQNGQKFMAAAPDNAAESQALLHLKELVRTGKGFVVADTPEYIEGTGYNVSRAVAKRLHSGEFSIQGHIDLHGQTVESARALFNQFFKESISSNKRMILIVHGRGLSSPAHPVLKTKVIKWLTTGPWRKWVMAYASARLCDGGAGATYVLLRKRPATKRFKRRGRPLKK